MVTSLDHIRILINRVATYYELELGPAFGSGWYDCTSSAFWWDRDVGDAHLECQGTSLGNVDSCGELLDESL